MASADDARIVSVPAFGADQRGGDEQASKTKYREDLAALMARGGRTQLEHADWSVTFFDPASVLGRESHGEPEAHQSRRLHES